MKDHDPTAICKSRVLCQRSEPSEVPGNTHRGYSQLHFGQLINGRPEIIVTTGLFDYVCYRFDTFTQVYVATTSDWVNSISLSRCINADDAKHLCFIGGKSLRELTDAGCKTIGLLLVLSRIPSLIDFLDNPALLAVLAMNTEKLHCIENAGLKRNELLAKALSTPYVRPSMIKTLTKVKIETGTLANLAFLLTSSLLWQADRILLSKNAHNEKRINALIRHQKRWSEQGLKHLARLLNRSEERLEDHARVLAALNSEGGPNYSNAYFSEIGLLLDKLKILEDRGECCSLPIEFYKKIAEFAQNPSDCRMSRVSAIRALLEREKGDALNKLLSLSIEDGDIAEPVFPGDDCVRHLSTCEELRRHALQQGNCIWSPTMIVGYLQRIWDIYEYRGETTVTISVLRRVKSIDQMQSTAGTAIVCNDLAQIMNWYGCASGGHA